MADPLSEKPKGELVKSHRALLSRFSRYREKVEGPTAQLFETILSGAGGAGAGVLDSKVPSIKGSFVSGGLVAGGAALAVALMVKNPTLKRQSLELANGLLAGTAAIRTYKAFEAKKK